MPSFIHTGDLHLGRSFRRLGSLGKELRRAQFETLRRTVDMVRQSRSGFLVIAGDLFDSNSVSGPLVRDVLECLASIAPVPVYILPGTHDVLDSGSVYRTVMDPAGLPPNVTVISEEPCELRPVPDVGVFAAANTTKKGGDRPLRRLSSLASESQVKYKVAALHASVNVPGLSIHPDEPLVSFEDISSSPFDYVAMGHWHKRQDWSRGKTRAFYCGSPETLEFDDLPSPGTVTLVRLGDGGHWRAHDADRADGDWRADGADRDDGAGGANRIDADGAGGAYGADRMGGADVVVEEKRVGTYRWVKVGLDLNLVPDMQALLGRVNQEAGKDTLLRLELRGNLFAQDSWLADFSLDDLREKIGPNFFFAEIDAGQLVLHEAAPVEFPPNSIGRAFHEIMTERIEKAQDPAQKEILQEALRRGTLYLSGKAGIRS